MYHLHSHWRRTTTRSEFEGWTITELPTRYTGLYILSDQPVRLAKRMIEADRHACTFLYSCHWSNSLHSHCTVSKPFLSGTLDLFRCTLLDLTSSATRTGRLRIHAPCIRINSIFNIVQKTKRQISNGLV